MPDLHHYNGRGGRAFPLWRDPGSTDANLPPKLLDFLAKKLKSAVTPDDLLVTLGRSQRTRRTPLASSQTSHSRIANSIDRQWQTVRRGRGIRSHGDLAAHVWRTVR